MHVIVHLITPIEEETMVPYWNVMFDDVEAGKDATMEEESKGVANVDHNSEVTTSFEPKGKSKKGYHTYLEALPSSSQSTVST
ncbi:hypothetical protein D8674_019852 [Pyrus ussuriensis x Pyrus communis]|uniref:Uncharacterized protein n=1 Tax=Pyrus ussuriensis x Pyrus communis TaxID=2448454 RepID=A0A5N5GEB7_9ROSA|nr:hypothetical protein D8674_019852 [Pyrus ussuriensis x Pyrus communis]